MKPEDWETLKIRNPSWNEIDLRDNRYDQILHLVTAAEGAEDFYTLDNNATRTEGLAVAKDIDKRCTKAWMGHPYIDVIDNRTNFDQKVARVLKVRDHDSPSWILKVSNLKADSLGGLPSHRLGLPRSGQFTNSEEAKVSSEIYAERRVGKFDRVSSESQFQLALQKLGHLF